MVGWTLISSCGLKFGITCGRRTPGAVTLCSRHRSRGSNGQVYRPSVSRLTCSQRRALQFGDCRLLYANRAITIRLPKVVWNLARIAQSLHRDRRVHQEHLRVLPIARGCCMNEPCVLQDLHPVTPSPDRLVSRCEGVVFLVEKLDNALPHMVGQEVNVDRARILLPTYTLPPESEQQVRKGTGSSEESDVFDAAPGDTVWPVFLTELCSVLFRLAWSLHSQHDPATVLSGSAAATGARPAVRPSRCARSYDERQRLAMVER